jgi:hypothetical protein
MILDILING